MGAAAAAARAPSNAPPTKASTNPDTTQRGAIDLIEAKE
jgi:hypothetical protein